LTLAPIFVLAFIVLFVRWMFVQAKSRVRRAHLSPATLAQIDQMDGRTFERYLHARFERLGYKVTLTPYQGDWGADLVVSRDGVKTVVQAKRYRKAVGVAAVQEVVAAKAVYNCSHALVVTNSRFTPEAITLAKANGVEMWNRERLAQELLASPPAPPQSVATVTAVTAVTAVTPSPELPEPSPSQSIPAFSLCASCGKPVSDAVAAFCREQAGKFGGRVYCYKHQRSARNAAKPEETANTG
jgi:restriction system protein